MSRTQENTSLGIPVVLLRSTWISLERHTRCFVAVARCLLYVAVCTFAREEVPKQTDEDEYLDCDYGSVTVSVSAYAAHDARREAKQQLANVPVPPHRA